MNGLNLDQGTAVPPKRMMEVTKTSDGYEVSLNPSSLQLLQTCPRKSMYSLRDGLVSKGSRDALSCGTAIHKAMEIYYAAPKLERILPAGFKENIIKMCQGEVLDGESSSLIYRATRGFIDSAEPLAHLESTEARSILNVGWLLGEYYEAKLNDPHEILICNGKPLVESLYETELYEENGRFGRLKINLFGTIDAIMENKSTGQILVCDHKTAGRVDKNLFNRTKPNSQFTAYIHLVQQCLNLKTDTFMINCFEVKAKPKTASGSGPNFLNVITKRSEEDIEEFIQTTAVFVKNYLAYLEDGFFPLGPVDACANYGKCSYLDICESPETIKPNIIEFNYSSTKDL